MDEPTIQGRPYVNPPLQAVLDLHGELLTEHGGAPGIRDLGALEASLARPFQLMAYGDGRLTIFDLAAAVCASVCRNHPFVDGNKRAAFLCIGLFLELNSWRLTASPTDAISAVMALASGKIGEAELTAWLKVNAHKAR